MRDLALATGFVIFVWWFSTGAIFYLVRLPRETHRVSMIAATAVLLAALYGLWVGGRIVSPGGAYLTFSCAVLVWGWAEVAFLTGILSGSRAEAPEASCSGLPRVRRAIQAILHHELALLALGAVVVGISLQGENLVGLWTFAVLWTMRLSAKLNLFLGVPISNAEFLPEHLGHLAGFFRRGPINPLFPVVVTAATCVTAVLLHFALTGAGTPFEAAAAGLPGILLALAVLEHWFMVVPAPLARMFAWALRQRDQGSTPADAATIGYGLAAQQVTGIERRRS